MTPTLSLTMRRYSIEPKQESMLKDIDFYHLLENIKSDYLIQDEIL